MNAEEFRTAGHRAVDWIADYYIRIAELPVMARTEPGAVRAQLPTTPPASPAPPAEVLDRLFEDLERTIVPGLSHWQHPDFYAFFPSVAEPASVVADFLSSGLGVLGLSWQSSPAVSELEEVVVDWVRQMAGLSVAWSGVIQDTASASTFVALVCARERASNYSLARGGLQGEERPLIVYMTEQTHSSAAKDALLAGFGRENVCIIPTDSCYAMRPEVLAAAIEADIAAGLTPCAVVATVGTTVTTALDPLRTIAQVTSQHGIWLHVDAALAGSAMILPECRWMWEGIERADSLVINAHKWLGVVFDCALYYVRDWQHLVRVMGTNPSYLQSAADNRVKNLRDSGIPLGRRFRALKLWWLIREQGVSGLQARLRRDIENAQWLAGQVRAAPDWRVLAPVPLQTVCVRHEPGLSGEALDTHTLAWVERVNRSGKAYLTPAVLDGRWMVRVSVGALATGREQMEALWALMQREARRS
jgi:aromatic-L-amino-acid decarboxylase